MLAPRGLLQEARNETQGDTGAGTPYWSRGESLIQFLIGMGIMSILLMTTATVISKAFRQNQEVSEKIDILNLENLLVGALADGSVCKHVLNNPAPLTFNSQALPQTITLPRPSPGVEPALYASILGGVPGPIIAQVGSTIGTSPATITSIQLEITGGASGTYRGNWRLNLNDPTGTRPLKPLSIGALLSVDDVTDPSRATIGDCSTVASNDTAPLKMIYYKLFLDRTNDCRNNPGVFTRSVSGTYPSVGDIFIDHIDNIFGSALYEMVVTAPVPTAVTQFLRHSENAVYFWLNGVKIDEETTFPGPKSRTITWNLAAGPNLVQVLYNNCNGGGEGLILIGDFFSRYSLGFTP